MLQSVLFLTGHSSLFFFSLNRLIREIPPKVMAVRQLSGFREWLSCSYSSLCPENVQATAVQQWEKRGTQNHWRTFCNSTSHSQCLGFGFSAHESALWRGMPCFNKNLTLYFPMGCCCCSRYPLRDQEQGGAAFWKHSGSCPWAHSFAMTNTAEEVGVFLASRHPCAVCIVPPWDEKSETACALTFFKVNGKNGRGSIHKIQRVLGYKINIKLLF